MVLLLLCLLILLLPWFALNPKPTIVVMTALAMFVAAVHATGLGIGSFGQRWHGSEMNLLRGVGIGV